MMKINKPENAKWSDSTWAKIEICPNYGVADFIRTMAEDDLVHAPKNSNRYNEALEVLRQLYAQDLLECDHSYTELVAIDDTRWLEPDGVHERSNPDMTKCLICEKYYEPETEEWVD